MNRRKRLAAGIEALAVYTLSLLVVRQFGGRLWNLPAPIGDISVPLVVWIYVPLMILLVRREDPAQYGLSLRRWPLSLSLALAVCLCVFPLYALGHYLFATYAIGLPFHPRPLPSYSRVLLSNLLLIALPEEVFFRGYLHTRLETALSRGPTVLGARITWGAIATAALFNAAHVIAGGHWWQGNLPFGILLGWLRSRTGSILAPAIIHGLMNVVFEMLSACF